MKQMTKEELIEYFIEQLGDNEILGQFITIEQIREKLKTVIRDVTYIAETENAEAHWEIESDGRGTINFDLEKILPEYERLTIVHELLHVLSTSIITIPRDTGNIGKMWTFISKEKISR